MGAFSWTGSRWATMLSFFALCAVLTGCGKKGEEDSVGGQVIAHVGKAVVTAPELENEFRLANIPSDKRADPVVKRVLQEIIVRKYLAQQALAAKIDREPSVLLGAIRAKEQLLASTLLQRRLSTKATSIGKGDTAKYITQHPAKFANRKILTIDQLVLAPGEKAKTVIEATKDLKTLAEVEAKCKELGLEFKRLNGELDTGALPEEFVDAIGKRGAEDLFFVQNGPNGTFFKIIAKKDAPLAGDEAEALALRALRMELLKQEESGALANASAATTYEGEYAKIMADAPIKQGASSKNAESKAPPSKPAN